jgi:hypothetical protein
VEKTVISCRADLPEPAPEPGDLEPGGPQADGTGPSGAIDTAGAAVAQDLGDGRLAVRARERHAAIHALVAQGKTHSQICKILGLSPKTVRKFMRAATAGQVITGAVPRSSSLDRFAPYLQQRWDQGCTDAAQLFTEIQAQGYRGSKRSARRYLQPLRATLTAPQLPPPPLTVREVTRWITSHPDHLTDEDKDQLSRVKDRRPQPSATAGHVTAFAEMMTGRHGERLPGWIAAVDAADLPHLHSFTRGIRTTRPPSPTASPWPTATVRSKATSAASRPSNARCSAAPASTCVREPCSAPDIAQSHQSRNLCQSHRDLAVDTGSGG